MKIENKNSINQELLEISPTLVQVEKNDIYSVPPSYFNILSSEIVQKIQAGNEPAYYFSPAIPFEVPERYFDSLPAAILQKVKLEVAKSNVFEEMEGISPILNTISKQPLFTVPKNYFIDGNDFLSATNNQKNASGKVVALKKTFPILRYAAAAVIAALLVVGGFLFTGKTNNDFQAAKDNGKVQVNKLSEEDILEYLKTNSAVEEAVTTSFKTSAKENDIKSSVSKMTDKEIKDFLKENGEAGEI